MKYAILLLAACWTARVQPDPAPVPVAANRGSWHEPDPDPASRTRSEAEIATGLAKQLRARGAQQLPSFVAGPVVVLDLDNNAFDTLCGMTAVRAAAGWGQLFIDPSRAEPMCIAGSNHRFTCVQVTSPELLIMELEDPSRWRITSVMYGDQLAGSHASNMVQMRARVDAASCP